MPTPHETETLIRGLAAEGLSILLVEHDVELVMNLSDHVVVMHQGAKLAEGPPAAGAREPGGAGRLLRSIARETRPCLN